MHCFSHEQLNDIRVLVKFTHVYCQVKHSGAKNTIELPEQIQPLFRREMSLCPDCAHFLGYALQKRAKCPLDPKPSCKHCHIHCYSAEYRQKAREIMSFSGRRLLLRGRLDYLWHYFF